MQLHYMGLSPPCRAVLLVAEAIGLEMELIEIDLMGGEHLTEEYEKLNPQKTVPFLIDGDVKLSESRAIMAYLADQYGQNDRLYPQNPEARAVVNMRLYFDLSTLFANIFEYYIAVFKRLTDTHDPAVYDKMINAFEILDKILDGQDYVAGRNLTIADLALVASVTTAEVFGFDVGEYKNVSAWLERVKTSAPGYRKANGEAVEIFKKLVEGSQAEKENEGDDE